MIDKELEHLMSAAKSDPELKKRLLATRRSDNAVEEFCAIARENGCSVTPGELFTMGLTESDAKLRSVNGGGVNPIDGWDDAYEQFLTTLEWTV